LGDLLVATLKVAQQSYFRGLPSPRPDTEPLRLMLTALCAYNNDIQLQNVRAVWL